MMKRRGLLLSLAALSATKAAAAKTQRDAQAAGVDLENPYAGVDWSNCRYVHSMSHQHQGQTDDSREIFRGMGYRHFAFSNYYPSAPTYPLPSDYLSRNRDVIGAPNAEQHSFTDSSLHFNSLGSMLATGYGSSLSAGQRALTPIIHKFDGLQVFESDRPWLGTYRLDVRLATQPGLSPGAIQSPALLTIEGATECGFRDNFSDKGPICERPLTPRNHTVYLRTTSPVVAVKLVYDKAQLVVTQFRLMQGSNRPWRDVFRAALDGEMIDGQHRGGLLFKDGGGITLNHPTGEIGNYLEMLDFDPRVLGIEVWNQLTSGFGSGKGFYDKGRGPHLHFYRLWDELSKSGRRCWGFFVKDHNTYGRGRNVLLMPSSMDLGDSHSEAAALRAYREGSFFGSVAALATNDEGKVVAPYDQSDFRFSRIVVRRNAAGMPVAIEASVTGNDLQKRPNIQIRFITEEGVAAIADGAEAEFLLPTTAAGDLKPAFVRVEAFAYPHTHLGGQSLTAEHLRTLNVYDISLLHDHKALGGSAFASGHAGLRTPVPIVDMIFSQPLRRVPKAASV